MRRLIKFPLQSQELSTQCARATCVQQAINEVSSYFLALLFTLSLATFLLITSSLVTSSRALASDDLTHPTHDGAASVSASVVGFLLSTDQILKTFSDTLDRGVVQGGSGISAETRWYASGRFETRWWRREDGDDAPEKVNRVTGRWMAQNNQRCVVFDYAPDEPWQCASVFQSDEGRLVSLNPDGSVHGIHQIAPLELSAEDPH
jgi:hypothetical protein